MGNVDKNDKCPYTRKDVSALTVTVTPAHIAVAYNVLWSVVQLLVQDTAVFAA